MRKLWFKLCSLLLVAVLLANMLPLQTFAEQLNTEDMSLVNPGADTSEKETATGKIVEELTDKRTEYTKQFRMDNGLFIAAVYNDPIHYEKDGQWPLQGEEMSWCHRTAKIPSRAALARDDCVGRGLDPAASTPLVGTTIPPCVWGGFF